MEKSSVHLFSELKAALKFSVKNIMANQQIFVLWSYKHNCVLFPDVTGSTVMRIVQSCPAFVQYNQHFEVVFLFSQNLAQQNNLFALVFAIALTLCITSSATRSKHRTN